MTPIINSFKAFRSFTKIFLKKMKKTLAKRAEFMYNIIVAQMKGVLM